jgi:foldase protein PrsA
MAIVIGIVLAVLAIIGVGIFGYYQTTIVPRQQAVLKVGDKTFRMSYVEKRIAYEVEQAGPTVQSSSQDIVVLTTVSTIEREEMVRLLAAQQGFTVSNDEIDAKIRSNLIVGESADAAAFAQAYRDDVRKSGLSASEYRDVVAVSVLEDKIRAHIKEAIPTNADQVHLYDIEVGTQDAAQQVIDRLNNGEDFGALVTQLSQDTTNKDKGGEMGWEPKDALDPAIGEPVFALQPGQWTTQPVSASGAYWVFKVTERSTGAEVTSDQQTAIEDQTLQNQITDMTNQTSVDRRYLPVYSDMWNKLVGYATKDMAKALGQ